MIYVLLMLSWCWLLLFMFYASLTDSYWFIFIFSFISNYCWFIVMYVLYMLLIELRYVLFICVYIIHLLQLRVPSAFVHVQLIVIAFDSCLFVLNWFWLMLILFICFNEFAWCWFIFICFQIIFTDSQSCFFYLLWLFFINVVFIRAWRCLILIHALLILDWFRLCLIDFLFMFNSFWLL